MAVETFSLALEERLAASGIALQRRTAPIGCRRHVMKISNDGTGHHFVVITGRHLGAGNALLDDPDQIPVCGRLAELSAAEIHAGNRVAIGTVAIGAIGEVDPLSSLDFRGSDAVLLLGKRGNGPQGSDQDRRRCHAPSDGMRIENRRASGWY